ncbi:MAG: PLP-dependent aminotransferase family protein [Thermomicrobiales bacterium]
MTETPATIRPYTADLPIAQLNLPPGIIDLAWGHPDPALLPVAGIQRATAEALDRFGAAALAYGREGGPGPLVAWLTERIARTEGRAPEPGELMITGGISHMLDQLCTLFTRPGDVILVEQPTYHLAVRIFREHPLELIPVPIDQDGLQVEAVAEVLAALRRAGRSPRFLYTVPTFHNPTGVSLRLARRRALVELAASEELLIVEDDAYRELAYDGPAPPSLWSLAPSGTVARLGSFSKAVTPGLRLGWLTAPAPMVARITGGGLLDSGGGINHYSANVMAAYCLGGQFAEQGDRLRAAYRGQRDALAAGLREHLPPGCVWTVPGGGFLIWVRLPAGQDAGALVTRAQAAGTGYGPGARFHLDGSGANALRLSFSYYQPDELDEGARRLGEVFRRAW